MAVAEDRLAALESGLDRLETAAPTQQEPSWVRRLVPVVLPKVCAAIILVAVWQLLSSLGVGGYALPAPLDVWHTFTDQTANHHVSDAILISLRRAALGFAIAVAIGTPLGLLLARVRVVRLALASLIAGLLSLPSVCWAPFGLILFGLNESTILFVVVMGATPSIAQGLMSAVDAIPPLLPRVGKVLGARGLDMYRHVILPAALPGYVAGLKQAWAFAWRSLMAAEIFGFSPSVGLGLGQLLDSGRELDDFALLVMSILVILIVGVFIDGAIFNPLDRGVRRRRGLEAA